MTMRVTIVEENTPTRPRFREILNDDGGFNNAGLDDEGPSAIKCSKFRVSTLFCIIKTTKYGENEMQIDRLIVNNKTRATAIH